MDPLSVTASVLAILTAAIATVKTLNETVERYKGRDKLLKKLNLDLEDLLNILTSLQEATDEDTLVWALLRGPVDRCAQVTREFEAAMRQFGDKSKLGLKDWRKMEFMRGNINDFIETLAGYKATITIGLGLITMHNAKLTQNVITEFGELVKDTSYDLNIHLQRIEDKLSSPITYQRTLLEDSSIDLQDEKAVTEQCLQICKRAEAFIQSLEDKQPTLQRETLQEGTSHMLSQFKAQLLTEKSLSDSKENLAATILRIQEHLNSTNFGTKPAPGPETLLLQQEMSYAKECLELCKEASSQVSSQKIHIFGEVIAEDDCDQFVVTSFADLFNVGKVKAKTRSMQFVGSAKGDELKQISKDRYGSRFGAVGSNLGYTQQPGVTMLPPQVEAPQAASSSTKSNQMKENGNGANSGTTYNKPSSNEVRKRKTEGEDGKK